MSSEHETTETQVALLKQELENQRRSLSDLTKSQTAQTEVIHSMDKKLDQVLENQNGIQKRVDTLDLQEAKRQLEEAKRSGVILALGAVASVLGGVAGWLASIFSNRHP